MEIELGVYRIAFESGEIIEVGDHYQDGGIVTALYPNDSETGVEVTIQDGDDCRDVYLDLEGREILKDTFENLD